MEVGGMIGIGELIAIVVSLTAKTHWLVFHLTV